MAKPTARVLRVLEVLQSGGTHRVADLAADLEVDERTVRRYVEHLLELDVPIEAVRGRHGGYRLAPGFRLPPLMLTDDEAVAVLLGLTLLRRSGLVAEEAAGRAEAKIRRVLPRPLASRLAALHDFLHLSAPAPATGADPADVTTLLTVAGAAREGRLVAFAYRSADGRESARVLAPYGLVAHRGRWLVSGVDQERDEPRTFRVDRMVLPRVLDRTFEQPADLDPLADVLAGFARAPRRHRVVVRARTTVDHARAALPPSVALVAEAEPGWVTVTIHAESLEWVPALLLRLGCPFVVDEPDELRSRVRDLAGLLVRAAEATEG